MKYKSFGNTGVDISVLGFGCMRFPTVKVNGKDIVDEESTEKIIHRAFELGVNYFDSAYFYCNGESEVVLGKAVRNIRDKVYISTKAPGGDIKKPGDCRRIFEHQLKKLNMEYVDFYHFHGIGHDSFFELDKESNWIREVQDAKSEGLIKHISFSFHDKPENMIKLVDTGLFESVLCQYNALDRSNEEAIAHAKAKGLGVVVMGPVGGGKLSGLPGSVAEKLGITVSSSAELAVKFVLSNPNVDCALSGMSNLQMVEENAAVASNAKPLSQEEIEAVKRMMLENEKLAQLYCTGCSYCMPCPEGVNIPHIFSMMNYHKVYGLTDFARNGYKEIGTNEWVPGRRADSCSQCGACEKKCPQKIPIRNQLKESHAAMG